MALMVLCDVTKSSLMCSVDSHYLAQTTFVSHGQVYEAVISDRTQTNNYIVATMS